MGSCSDGTWAASVNAYNSAGTDVQLQAWWNQQPNHDHFARQLAQAFGDQPTYFACGIQAESTCTIAGCKTFIDESSPAWSYQALVSVVNLNNYFNSIYDGVVAGQLDFTNQIPTLISTFYADPKFMFQDLSPWLSAIFVILMSIGGLLVSPALAPAAVAGGVTGGFAAIAGAGVTMEADRLESLEPPSSGSVTDLQAFAQAFGVETRNWLSDWANGTFLGTLDSSGTSILDYIKGGAFVDSRAIPAPRDIEAFYTKQMIARAVNAQYSTEKVYGLLMSTNDSQDASGPNQTRYYSPEEGKVLYIYQFHDTGVLQGTVGKPKGLDDLNGTLFSITGKDMAVSSYKAYQKNKYNFTFEDGSELLNQAMVSGQAAQPFVQGAAWPGTWTIPICDTGTYNWNTQFGNSGNPWPPLPCCCGAKCADTKAFVNASNFLGSQTFLRACHTLLRDTDINFENIDYGFQWQNSFPMDWQQWNAGIRAGVVIAFIAAAITAIGILICCCLRCCGG